jgi:hypothetical protein
MTNLAAHAGCLLLLPPLLPRSDARRTTVEGVMKRTCAHCGTEKFGLIRYRKGAHVYWSRKCRQTWEHANRRFLAEIADAQRRHFAYLARGSP